MSKDWKTFWRTKMETMMGTKASEVPVVTTAAEKAEQLKSAIEALQAQRAGLDRKRTDQLTAVRNAQTRRGHLVAQLAGADVKVAERLHTQINSVDTDIVAAQRVAESLEAGQSKVDEEINALSAQLEQASETARREAKAREDEASQVALIEIEARGERISDEFTAWLAEFNAASDAHKERGPLQSNQADELVERFLIHHKARVGRLDWRHQQTGVIPMVEVKPMLPPVGK
jgi:chromosome segregation ATPase